MKRRMCSLVLGGLLASAGLVATAAAEEAKTLPTLLIRGEVVSLDMSDAAAPLLKVKDRYGFETPIYLPAEVKISKAGAAVASSDLTPGAAVEVEYNFDVNTAKRHAVTVKLGGGETTEAASPEAPAAPTPSETPAAAEAAPAPAATEAAAPTPAPAEAPASESAAPATAAPSAQQQDPASSATP